MPAVHLAGNRVVLGDRIIQRCLICGERLSDNLNVAMPVGPNGEVPQFVTWGVGDWVEHDGNRWSVIGTTESPEFGPTQIPANCCVDLIEL